MKKLFAPFILLLATGLTIAGQTNWIKYQSPEGRYSISVPTEPKIRTQDTTTSTGEKLPQILASSIDGNGVFMVGYFDYTADMTFSLDKARDGLVNSMKATLLGDQKISLGGAPGLEVQVIAKSNIGTEFIDRARFYDINKRVYVLQCIFPKAEDGPAIVAKCDRFGDSFKVINP